MKAENVNPFIGASQNVIKMLCNADTKIGKVHLKMPPNTYNEIIVLVGLVGKIRGGVCFEMSADTAKRIASMMMAGLPVEELDEMSKSAISEMGNMIMGNASTKFADNGISLDITPPALLTGDNIAMSSGKGATIVVPLEIENIGLINININAEEVI